MSENLCEGGAPTFLPNRARSGLNPALITNITALSLSNSQKGRTNTNNRNETSMISWIWTVYFSFNYASGHCFRALRGRRSHGTMLMCPNPSIHMAFPVSPRIISCVSRLSVCMCYSLICLVISVKKQQYCKTYFPGHKTADVVSVVYKDDWYLQQHNVALDNKKVCTANVRMATGICDDTNLNVIVVFWNSQNSVMERMACKHRTKFSKVRYQ